MTLSTLTMPRSHQTLLATTSTLNRREEDLRVCSVQFPADQETLTSLRRDVDNLNHDILDTQEQFVLANPVGARQRILQVEDEARTLGVLLNDKDDLIAATNASLTHSHSVLADKELSLKQATIAITEAHTDLTCISKLGGTPTHSFKLHNPP